MRRRQALAKDPAHFAVNTVRQTPAAPQGAVVMRPAPIEAVDHQNGFDRLPDAALGDVYLVKFGKRPHHRMKRDTIIARLEE